MTKHTKQNLQTIRATILATSLVLAPHASAYTFDEIVPDVRQGVAISGGGSACPVRAHQLSSPGSIAVRWSTALSSSPITILTQDQTPNGQLTEIEQVITQSIGAWMGVDGTTLTPSSLAPLTRVANANACGSDGVNSICFDQLDGAFTPGVLAFTRVITADRIGVQVGSGAPATQVGQILDGVSVGKLVRWHLDDLTIDDLLHALHLRKREPFFVSEDLRTCRHGGNLFF